MSTYRATGFVSDGTLHTARPLTAPAAVVEVIDSVLHDLVNGDGTVTSVEVIVGTREDSGTPVADGIGVERSEPLGGDVDEGPATSFDTDLDVTPSGRRLIDATADDDEVPTLTPGGQA